MSETVKGGVEALPDPRVPSIPEARGVRRSAIAAAVSACLAVLLSVGFAGSPAFGAASTHRTIPAGFRAQSLSWVSPTQGWMLGVAPCASSSACTTVVGTTDGGATWNTLGALGAPLTLEDETGVTQIRFADALHGWAIWPAFWATKDGGVTWKKQVPPGGGRQVLALAGNSDGVYAVVSPCRLNRPCTDPLTLWRSTVSGGPWTQVPVTLPVAVTPVLAVYGVVAYLAVPAGLDLALDVLDVTLDGQNWISRPDPCHPENGETLTSIAPISDTKLALLCQGNIGFGKAAKFVLRSNDNGQTTQPAGTMPLYGIVSQLAAAPNGTLVAATFSIGSWIYRNGGGQTWTTPVDLGDGGIGWNDVSFTTNLIGFVIHGPATCCGGFGPGELWETQDGGLTWGPV
jgi:hypothetical protein